MRVLFNSIALAGLFLATPALAEQAEETYVVAIPYGDLNIANPAGLDVLKGRINAASKQMCGDSFKLHLQEAMASKRCAANFRNSAERQLQVALAPRSGTLFASR